VDCGEGLVCFQRNPGDPVPGCDQGIPVVDTDYCISRADLPTKPPTFFPTTLPSPPLTPVPSPGLVSDSVTPLPTFIETLAPTILDPTSMPTPFGTAAQSGPTGPEVSIRGDNWDPVSAFPLQHCEGDW
jgi:hypothetical protein